MGNRPDQSTNGRQTHLRRDTMTTEQMIVFDQETGQYVFNPKQAFFSDPERQAVGATQLSLVEETKKEMQQLNERIFKIHKAFRQKQDETQDE